MGATAQTYRVEPQNISQGQTLKVFGDRSAKSARLGDRTIPVFEQNAGYSLGLMPIGVLLKPGIYSLEWLDAQGKPIHTQSLAVADAHYARQNVVLSKALTQLKSTQDERETVGAFLERNFAVAVLGGTAQGADSRLRYITFRSAAAT